VSVLHAIILGIVQGLSEFLPISSSGHLILVPELFGWNELTSNPSLNKTFDVALHLGTLVAAVWYFRRDVWRYLLAALQTVKVRKVTTTDERLAWLLLLSAVPGAIVGALFGSTIEEELGDPILVGVMLIVFGFVLLFVDRLGGDRPSDDFRRRDAVIMGLAQAVALQPGVSRAGVTMTAGRWLKFDRAAAARLSFLMSIPIIAGAGLYKGAEVIGGRGIPSGFIAPFIWGTIAAAVSGFLAIAWLLRYLQTNSFMPFVIYRWVVGGAVIVIFATGLR
jgi:undecaprenyl-diphosphatase